MRAEVLLSGGTIYTLDPVQPRVEALAIRNGRIIAIGDEADVRAVLSPGYEFLDLRGGAAIPGLCDAHVHLLSYALSRQRVELEGISDYEALLAGIDTYATRLPQDAWVRGWGWNHTLWGGRWPTAADLDRVTGGRPAALSRKDGHSVWVNSAALRLAGIDAQTPDPPGGEIQRDERGEPTGILLENAMDLVWRVVPEAGPEERQHALREALAEAQRYGLTSLHLPEPPACLSDLQVLYGRGQPGARILFHIPQYRLDEALALGVRSGLGDEWLRIGGVKIFSDGSLGSCTCHMLQPFEGTQSCGIPTLSREELFELIARAIGGGISVTVHAIGDAANRSVLDAIETALLRYPQRGFEGERSRLPTLPAIPNRIEHAQIVHPLDIPRFARLGVVASMQPIHATSDMTVADQLWGSRCATAYAWRALHSAGAILAFGSDAPVETFNPWPGIHAAVTRQLPDGEPPGGWYPEQRLSLEEALWAYAVGPAIASGEIEHKGTLTPGKLADIVVLPADPFRLPAGELHSLLPVATLLGGEVVYEGGS